MFPITEYYQYKPVINLYATNGCYYFLYGAKLNLHCTKFTLVIFLPNCKPAKKIDKNKQEMLQTKKLLRKN